jgi:hypothetical protein
MSYADRIDVAMRLCRHVDDCAALLRGESVDADRLDPTGLAWALMLRLVRLDGAAIDEFFGLLYETEDLA